MHHNHSMKLRPAGVGQCWNTKRHGLQMQTHLAVSSIAVRSLRPDVCVPPAKHAFCRKLYCASYRCTVFFFTTTLVMRTCELHAAGFFTSLSAGHEGN